MEWATSSENLYHAVKTGLKKTGLGGENPLSIPISQFTKDKTELALEKVSNAEIKTYLETQDLSYLEYESATEKTQNTTKAVLDGLNIDKQDILEHLENQDIEEDI